METNMEQTLSSAIKNYPIPLTDQAKALITQTIEAIGRGETLPYGIEPKSRTQCQWQAIEQLPKLLDFVAKSRRKTKIGFFDLLDAAPQITALYLVFKGPD